MTKEKILELINLLKQEKTCNEICQILNLSNKQLYYQLTILKNKGFNYKREYHSNGDIKYIPVRETQNERTNQKTIITDLNENKLECLLISDIHFGNNLERIDLLQEVYNYAIKNNIHLIICCGDLIDGTFTRGSQYIKEVSEQMEYLIQKYPFNKHILNFAVGGDHDISALINYNQNIIDLLNNYRHDIVISDYNNSFVNLKNDQMQLFHHIGNRHFIKSNSTIILHGHSHDYKVDFANGKLHINVPALSNINNAHPTFLLLTLYFQSGYINNVTIKQISFNQRRDNFGTIKIQIPIEDKPKTKIKNVRFPKKH